jgi:hypothetical protein
MYWAVHAVNCARRRAKKKNLPCDITAAYVVSIMTERCPVFNTKFKFTGNKTIRPESPTLDRKIPSKGYIKGNVVIVSNRANMIKGANSANAVYMVYKWMKSEGLK